MLKAADANEQGEQLKAKWSYETMRFNQIQGG